MFNGLNNEIKRLNNDVKTVVNCKKAKKLRKKLLCIGIPMAIVGFLCAFTCFILFTVSCFSGFTPLVLIPFLLFVPFNILGAIGASITSLGLQILITGYTSNLVDETIGNNCPKCGDVILDDELFCSKCGTKLKIECSNCKTINSYKNNFCSKCGKKL